MSTSVLTLRIPDSQKEMLEKQAGEKGLNLSQYAGGLLCMGLNSAPILDRESLPSVEAIYLIVGSNGKLRYLGKANDLNAAIADHPLLGDILIKDHQSRVVWFGHADDMEIEGDALDIFKFPLPRQNAFVSLREDVNALKNQQAEILDLLQNLNVAQTFQPPTSPVDAPETAKPSPLADTQPIQPTAKTEATLELGFDIANGLSHSQMAQWSGGKVTSLRTSGSQGRIVKGMRWNKNQKLWFPVEKPPSETPLEPTEPTPPMQSVTQPETAASSANLEFPSEIDRKGLAKLLKATGDDYPHTPQSICDDERRGKTTAHLKTGHVYTLATDPGKLPCIYRLAKQPD